MSPQRQALNSAFAGVHGVTDVFDDIAFTGGMDLPLMVEVYRKYDLTTVGSDGLPLSAIPRLASRPVTPTAP